MLPVKLQHFQAAISLALCSAVRNRALETPDLGLTSFKMLLSLTISKRHSAILASELFALQCVHHEPIHIGIDNEHLLACWTLRRMLQPFLYARFAKELAAIAALIDRLIDNVHTNCTSEAWVDFTRCLSRL